MHGLPRRHVTWWNSGVFGAFIKLAAKNPSIGMQTIQKYEHEVHELEKLDMNEAVIGK